MTKYHVEYTDKKGEHHDVKLDAESEEEEAVSYFEDEIDTLIKVGEA